MYYPINVGGYKESDRIEDSQRDYFTYYENRVGLILYHSIIVDTIKTKIPINIIYIEVLNKNTMLEKVIIPLLHKLGINLNTKIKDE